MQRGRAANSSQWVLGRLTVAGTDHSTEPTRKPGTAANHQRSHSRPVPYSTSIWHSGWSVE
jgi:hypothetical protein